MVTTALKDKAIDYLTMLDDERARLVISYMENLKSVNQKPQKTLLDLKGKIRFAEGYDYKAMRTVS